MADDDKRLTPLMVFILALLPIFGGGLVYVWDRWDATAKDSKIEELYKTVGDLQVRAQNAEDAIKECEFLRDASEKSARQKEDYIDDNLGQVGNLWSKYYDLVERIISYQGELHEPTNDPGKQQTRAAELASRTNRLIAFVKTWRAASPYLCGLVGPQNDRLEDAARAQDADKMLQAAQDLDSHLDDQKQILKLILQTAKQKSLVDLPCLCSRAP